jgi:hypothetical protein
VLLWQRWTNGARLASQTPPLLEFSQLQVYSFYGVAAALICLLVVWIARAQPPLSRRLRFVFAALIGFFVLRGVVIGSAYGAPTERAKLALSADHVASASDRVAKYFESTGRLPVSLSDAAVEDPVTLDGWGFRLSYSVEAQGASFRIRAVGVPEAARKRYADKWPTEIVRTVGARASG